MTTNRLAPDAAPTQAPASRTVHLSDYWAILRDHKWIALIPFMLILGGALALTLLSDPVYEASAILEIESPARRNSLLTEIELIDTTAKVEAEMEIMRSRRVADGAATILITKRKLADLLVEVNAHRPLEVFLRAFLPARPPCRVEIESTPDNLLKGAGTFEFRFVERLDETRYALEAVRVRAKRFGDSSETERVDIVPGETFNAFGRRFRLMVEGDPVGRAYRITLRPRRDFVNWLRAHTTVAQLGRNTGIVALGFKAETPRMAKAASQALAHSYEDEKKRKKRYKAEQAVTFLEGEVTRNKEELKLVEADLDKFRSQEGVTLLSERAKLWIEQISALDREKAALMVKLREHESLVRDLENGELDPESLASRTAADDPTFSTLVNQLADLDLLRASLPDDVRPEHPDVIALELKVSLVRRRLREHVLVRARTERKTTQEHLRRVERFKAEYEAKEAKLPEKERTVARLTRQSDSLLSIHNFLLEKKHEAQIARASTVSNVSIVDDPVMPRTRTSPNLLVNCLVGLFLALLAALGTAFFAEYVDRSVKSPEELEEATGLPLYAALPSFKSVRSRDVRKLKSQMVTIEKPQSVLSEGYRSLRANIRFADFESPVRALAITSAVLGEGKTTTTLNLAVVLAQAGSKVIVVDADLRRPATHVHLDGKLKPGLTDILTGQKPWKDIRRPVQGVENLDVIHAGRKPPNPSALLDSKALSNLLAELKTEYDYVIFDVPPVLAVSDAASFFGQLDAVFLLVQWRRCPLEIVLAARDQIERVGAKLRGVIFNGFDARKSNRRGYGRYGYYGYYGGYKRYGYGYGYYGYGGERETRSKKKKEKEKGARAGT